MGYTQVHRSFGKANKLETFSKNLLIGLNTIFIVFGFILFIYGCGGKTSTNRDSYVAITAEGGDIYQITSTVLIIIGGISVLMGLWGLNGIHTYSKAFIYVSLLLLLAFTDISLGIYSSSLESSAKVSVEHNLITSLQKLKNSQLASSSDSNISNSISTLRDKWDALQSELRCCGIYEYRDWYFSTLSKNIQGNKADNHNATTDNQDFLDNHHFESSEDFMRIPHSCFKNGDDGMDEADFNNPVSPEFILENLYGDGCLDKTVIDLDIGRMQRVGVLLAVVKLLAALCATVLACYLNNDKATQNYYA